MPTLAEVPRDSGSKRSSAARWQPLFKFKYPRTLECYSPRHSARKVPPTSPQDENRPKAQLPSAKLPKPTRSILVKKGAPKKKRRERRKLSWLVGLVSLEVDPLPDTFGNDRPVRSDTRKQTGFFAIGKDNKLDKEIVTPSNSNTSSEGTTLSPQKTCKAVSESEMFKQESQKSDDDGSSSGFGSDDEEDDEYDELFKLARENMMANQTMVKAARAAYEAAPPKAAQFGENGAPLLPFATKRQGSNPSLSDTPREPSPKATALSVQSGGSDHLAVPSAPHVDEDAASSFGSSSDGEAEEQERHRKPKGSLMGSPAAAAVAFAGFPATAPPAGLILPQQARRIRGTFDDTSSFASSSDEEEVAKATSNEAPKSLWGVSSGSTSPSLAVGSGCSAAKLLRKDVGTPCSSFADSDDD